MLLNPGDPQSGVGPHPDSVTFPGETEVSNFPFWTSVFSPEGWR